MSCGGNLYLSENRKLPEAPNVSSGAVSLWKMSNLVFIRTRNRAGVQTFWTVGSVRAPAWIWAAQSAPGWWWAQARAGPRWVLAPHGCDGENTQRKVSNECHGEKVSCFFKVGLYYMGLREDQTLFEIYSQFPKPSWAYTGSSSYPIHFLDLLGFCVAYPIQSFSQPRLTGFFDSHVGSYCTCVYLAP